MYSFIPQLSSNIIATFYENRKHSIIMHSRPCDENTPRDYIQWSYMTGGLSLHVQIYRTVGPCYCSSGLSLQVGLSS